LAQVRLAHLRLFQLALTGKYSLLVLLQLQVFAGLLNLLLVFPVPQSQAKVQLLPGPLPPTQPL
jgi:hypothetical protein